MVGSKNGGQYGHHFWFTFSKLGRFSDIVNNHSKKRWYFKYCTLTRLVFGCPIQWGYDNWTWLVSGCQMVWYSNGGLKTAVKKVCLWSKIPGIWMVRQVTWLYHWNTGHPYSLVFRWIRYSGVRYSDGDCMDTIVRCLNFKLLDYDDHLNTGHHLATGHDSTISKLDLSCISMVTVYLGFLSSELCWCQTKMRCYLKMSNQSL